MLNKQSVPVEWLQGVNSLLEDLLMSKTVLVRFSDQAIDRILKLKTDAPAIGGESMETGVIGWESAQTVADTPSVYEALEAFSHDSTEDNAVALVREIAAALTGDKQ